MATVNVSEYSFRPHIVKTAQIGRIAAQVKATGEYEQTGEYEYALNRRDVDDWDVLLMEEQIIIRRDASGTWFAQCSRMHSWHDGEYRVFDHHRLVGLVKEMARQGWHLF